MTERAQDLEAPDMRAEKETTRAARQLRLGEFFAFDRDVEELDLVVEQIDPVEHARGESEIMAEKIDRPRIPAEGAAEIAAGSRTRIL